jgi:hypothetical protein
MQPRSYLPEFAARQEEHEVKRKRRPTSRKAIRIERKIGPLASLTKQGNE